MDMIDISTLDLEFDVMGSSVQKFLDGALDNDYFNLDLYETVSDISDVSFEHESSGTTHKRKVNSLEEHQSFKLARPRIVKSDFRRSFPQMWASVFNSTSYETMRSHIRTFYDESVSVLQQDLRTAADPARVDMSRGPEIGHDYLSEFWYRSMKIAPDLVCTLKHTYVKVRSDGTSSIKCTFGLTGTKVITVDGQLLLTDGSRTVNLRPVHAVAQNKSVTPADDFQRYTSCNSSNCLKSNTNMSLSSESTGSTQASDPQRTDPLPDILQRYLKASNAVSRSKALPNESRRKRRNRLLKAASHNIPVEEWLAVSKACAQADDSYSHNNFVQNESFAQHACVVNDTVCISPTNRSSLRGDNDRTLPVARAYNVEHGQKGETMLTADFNITCAIEMNFNADHRIVSLVIKYLD